MPHFCLCDSGYEEVGGLQLSTGMLLSTCMYPYYLDSCSLPLLVMFLGVGGWVSLSLSVTMTSCTFSCSLLQKGLRCNISFKAGVQKMYPDSRRMLC